MITIAKNHRDIFLWEARNHIRDLNQFLVMLEKKPGNNSIITKIFTELHTLKSSASIFELNHIASLCHEMEDLFEKIRDKKICIQSCSNILFHCLDHLARCINTPQSNDEVDSKVLIKKIRNLDKKKKNVSVVPDSTLMIDKIRSIEVKIEQLDSLMNLTEEILINKMKLESIHKKLNIECYSTIEALGRVVNELQYQVMQIRLVPLDYIFCRFLRMARDIAKQQDKEINLQLIGGNIELDRLLMDEIAESIAHLIRNSIDHGIENAVDRVKLKKPSYGTITIKVKRLRENAIIEIIDDGRGLDQDMLKAKAIKKGLIDETASNDEITNLIFKGISTAKEVTLTSGRGYGLQTVVNKLQTIGGKISVAFSQDKFTRFTMNIPLTLAIINALFVRVAKQTYAIPIESVYRMHFIKKNQIKKIFNKETVLLNDKDISIIRLSSLFNLHDSQLETSPIVIIQNGKKLLAVMVDVLLTTQSVIIKPLSHILKNNKYFSGATFSASGEMTLILDTTILFQG